MTRRPRKRERRADIDPETMGSAIQRYTELTGMGKGLAVARMRQHWEDIVGPILAPRCRAEKLSLEGVLQIDCEHGVTANEVSMLSEAIRASAAEIGRVSVSQLDVRVRRTRPGQR